MTSTGLLCSSLRAALLLDALNECRRNSIGWIKQSCASYAQVLGAARNGVRRWRRPCNFNAGFIGWAGAARRLSAVRGVRSAGAARKAAAWPPRSLARNRRPSRAAAAMTRSPSTHSAMVCLPMTWPTLLMASTMARSIGSSAMSFTNTAVDLQKVHRQVLQIGERRHARAEVVQREPAAQRSQLLDEMRGLVEFAMAAVSVISKQMHCVRRPRSARTARARSRGSARRAMEAPDRLMAHRSIALAGLLGPHAAPGSRSALRITQRSMAGIRL